MLATMPPKASSASSPCSAARRIPSHVRCQSVRRATPDRTPRRRHAALTPRLRGRRGTATAESTPTSSAASHCARLEQRASSAPATPASACDVAAPASNAVRRIDEPHRNVDGARRRAWLAAVRRPRVPTASRRRDRRSAQPSATSRRRRSRRAAPVVGRRCALAASPPNTGDKLRSGARVHAVDRRGHEAACPCWQPCRRKLRQLHPLVRRRASIASARSGPGESVACPGSRSSAERLASSHCVTGNAVAGGVSSTVTDQLPVSTATRGACPGT